MNHLLTNFAITPTTYAKEDCYMTILDYYPMKKKSEMIYLEHGVKIPRQTTYYHESIFSEAFLKRQEEMNAKLLEQRGIKPTGYYNYDEQISSYKW